MEEEKKITEEPLNIEVPAEQPAEAPAEESEASRVQIYDIPEPEPEKPHVQTKEEDRTEIILGGLIGALVGVIMFIIPNKYIEEGSKLFISVVLIILGPRLMMDKLHLEFKKGRYAMAGALLIVLIIYILMGHPVD